MTSARPTKKNVKFSFEAQHTVFFEFKICGTTYVGT